MKTPPLKISSWPPFGFEGLPKELSDFAQDWTKAPLKINHFNSDSFRTNLVSLVIPCFNPDPVQFSMLLLSLNQQTDQYFDVYLVNDGSKKECWDEIQQELRKFPWIHQINLGSNQGISAALNLAVNQVKTPFVALVDQDDFLHPATLSIINSYLRANPACKFVYTDHITFDDNKNCANYILKFPWDPYALLQFNYLIHLTVVKVSLYIDCGGMNSTFDGIQDWEFHI